MLQLLYDAYNSEESFFYLWLFSVLWTSAYVYGKANGQEYHEWLFLHNVHNITAIVLGAVCLLFPDVLDEKILIFFSITYFTMDLIDCIIRRDYAYTAHAFFCVTLSLGNYSIPACRTLRTQSMASLIELSSPILHVAKKTRKPSHFLVFFLVFTACRIVWVPIIMKRIHNEGILFPYNPVQLLLMGFYALNCFWYYKIVRIVLGGGKSKSKNSKEENEEKEE